MQVPSERTEVPLLIAFVDLAGYAMQCTRVDDAEVANVVDGYYELVATGVTAAGGRVVKNIGDGILIVFDAADADAGISAALQEKQIANDSIRPDYVVVGEGHVAMEKVLKGHELIEKGARLVATNPDNWCPVTATSTRPGAGALAAFLEASTGCRAYYLGKPNPYMFNKARQRLGRNVENVVMVGDTMETDIRGGIEAGMQAHLVLTGSTPIESLLAIGDTVNAWHAEKAAAGQGA